MRTLLDTGPLVAMLYRPEQHHEWSISQAASLRPPFYSCEAVLAEAHYLLKGVSAGTRRLVDFVDRSVIDFSFSFSEHRARIHALLLKYEDVPMSFADACLVCMAEQEPSRVFTIDHDFEIYRIAGRKRIELIIP